MKNENSDLATLFSARSAMATNRRNLALKLASAEHGPDDAEWQKLLFMHQCIKALDAALADTEELLGNG